MSVVPRANAVLAVRRIQPVVLCYLALALLFMVSSVLWDVMVLSGDPVVGRDFGAFYAAGVTWLHGHDPYSWAQIAATEAHLPSIGVPRAPMPYNTFANPPLFAIAMAACAGLGPRAAYLVWLALMAAALLCGIVVAARSLLSGRHVWLPALFALTPIPVIALVLGQQTPLLLLGLAVALAALRRSRPALAGACLSVGWIKPHLVVPLVLLIAVMLRWREAPRLLAAFGGATLALCAASLLTGGGTLLWSWLRDLTRYGQTMDAVQPDLSSLAGLYLSVTSRPLSTVLEAGCIVAWCALAALIARATRRSRLDPSSDIWLCYFAIGLCAWLLAVPYAHPHDLVLLAVALPPLLGRDLRNLRGSLTRVALCLLLVAPEADLLGFRPTFVLSYSVAVPLAFLLALRPLDLIPAQRAT